MLLAATNLGQVVPFSLYRACYRSSLPNAVFKDMSPFRLHYSMFMPTIIGQADEEQKKYWLKRAVNFEIIGTYAQVCQFFHIKLSLNISTLEFLQYKDMCSY